jgi:hypothetical protein
MFYLNFFLIEAIALATGGPDSSNHAPGTLLKTRDDREKSLNPSTARVKTFDFSQASFTGVLLYCITTELYAAHLPTMDEKVLAGLAAVNADHLDSVIYRSNFAAAACRRGAI